MRLIDFRPNLEPHMRPILAARKLREVRSDAAWKVVSLAGQVVEKLSPFGWLTFARDAWSLIAEDRRTERQLLQVTSASPAEHVAAHLRELETQVLETFRLILDPSNAQATTVPVILVLDDAQWADPTTLRFLLQLLRAATLGKWALLVLATHWEAEWKNNVRDAPVSAENPTQLADLPDLLGLGQSWAGAKVIPPIADLGALVTAALPGVSTAQCKLILDKAGGNPRLLEEIFHHLLSHPQLFEARDLTKPLTARAETDIRERSFDYHELVDERFCRLEEHVRRALGWSSSQGMRFLTIITEAIARRVVPEFDINRLRPALETAEDPHCFVQLFRDQGRFNLGEFRQAAFQHVARENLAFDAVESAAVESALQEVLASWLKLGLVDSLEPAERRDVLAMALRVFSADKPETRGPRAMATARLACLQRSEYLWSQAHQLARSLADAAPEGWSLEELPATWQCETIFLLLQMRDLQRARRVATSFVAQLTRRPSPPVSLAELRNGFLALTLLGDVERALGERESALAAYRRGLEISERLIAEFGETPQSLRDVSVSLNKVGDVERVLGEHESALAVYRCALEIRERLVSEFGETPQSLRDVLVSLGKVGDVEGALGERESALAAYRRGLEISERLVSEFGETPQSLRDVSVSLNKVGDVERVRGERQSALAAYRRALEIRERFIPEFGETPQSLRDVSVSLSKVGDVERVLGERQSAVAAYRRALEISERLISEFGETPESLRDLMISLITIASVSEKSEAVDRLRQAQAITEKIVAHGWAVPQNHEDQAWIAAVLRRLEGDAEERDVSIT